MDELLLFCLFAEFSGGVLDLAEHFMISNNFSVQLYCNETDRKLDILYINNTIGLDDEDENFTELFETELLDYKIQETIYNLNDIYYSIL